MTDWFTSGSLLFGKKHRPEYSKPSGEVARPKGFSEDALQGLRDLDARTPPPDVETRPAFTPSYKRTERLSKEASAGGGLVLHGDGNKVPHYWGHRERLRKRFLAGGHKPMPEYEICIAPGF